MTVLHIVENGPSSNRVDVLFLGDGYTTPDIAAGVYRNHIDAMLQHLFQDNEEPFQRYRNFFNVHAVEVVSNQSGVDDLPNNIFVDTALDGELGCFDSDRLICIDYAEADRRAQEWTGSPEMRLVAVNTSLYGGAGGPYAVYAGGNGSGAEIALHEIGHSFSGLADEYSHDCERAGAEPTAANVTLSAAGARWSQWIGYDQPGIGVISAYPGAYCENLYRPSLDSKMRSLRRPFDAVSREQIILDIYRYVDPIDQWLSNDGFRSTSDVLVVTVVDPQVISVQWWVDGQIIPEATGESFRPSDFGITNGIHTVTVRAIDGTDWVRRNRDQLEQTVTWSIDDGQAGSPIPVVSISTATGQVSEGASGGGAITIRRSGSSVEALNVRVSVSGSASLTDDFSLIGDFIIPAGSDSRTISLIARDDGRAEQTETVVFTIEADSSYFVGSSATATILIKDIDRLGPRVAGLQFLAARAASFIRVDFSEDVAAAAASDPANYSLKAPGRDKRLGTSDDVSVAVSAVQYDAAGRFAIVSPRQAIRAGQFVELAIRATAGISDLAGNPLDGNGDGTSGDDYVSRFARGTKLSYADSTGDLVTLNLARGGVMMLSLDRNGDGMDLELIGTVPNRSTLAGTVKRGRSGDGITTLRSISGLAGVNRDRLRSPPFVVGAIAASVVDSLLETHSPAANSLSQLGDAAD